MDGFSVERLMIFLTASDQDVEITIKKQTPVTDGGAGCHCGGVIQ